MRKTINCFIPYRESTAAEQTIHALKESSIVNKIYLLNIEPNKTLSTPEGCEILPVDSLTSSKTMKMIAEKADTPYILLYTKTSALELAYKALERMRRTSCRTENAAWSMPTIMNGKTEKRRNIPSTTTNPAVCVMISTSVRY